MELLRIVKACNKRCMRSVMLLFGVGVVYFCYVFDLSFLYDTSQSHRPETRDPLMKQYVQAACHRPEMELWPPQITQHIRDAKPLECYKNQQDWVFVDKDILRINPQVLEEQGNVTCNYKPLVWGSDFSTTAGDPIYDIQNGFRINSDFFEVECKGTNNVNASYNNVHSAIHPKQDAGQNHSEAMNILMFGFDSVSRLNWMRNLPKSYQYFVDVLGGVVLEGYNIVGDGTPQALLPILTGMTEVELPESRRGFADAKHVDEHPWIFKDLRTLGYVTQWGEDGAGCGTFQCRMLGFWNCPVDHYFRTFQLHAENYYYWRNPPLCLGSKPRHINMMEWVKDFFVAYLDTPKFSFVFHSELSHDSFSNLRLADDDMLDFLQVLNSGGHLDNTMLVLMADHGARFAAVRSSQQGKYEERLPFFSFRLPKAFSDNNPDAMDNLRSNVNALTTPFDVHATFQDVLNITNGTDGSPKRGISLFKKIPFNRTCDDADIPPHWCTCMQWNETSTTDENVLMASNELLNTINQLMENVTDKCEVLVLDFIINAKRYTANDHVLRFKQSADTHGRVPDMTDSTAATEELYQVTLSTMPGGGVFEATIAHSSYGGESRFTADLRAVSRTNRYGDDPHCVSDHLPHLRPYCRCKSPP